MCDVSRDLPTPCVCWSAKTVRESSPDSSSIYNCLRIFYLCSQKHTGLPWFPPTFVGLDIVRFLYQTRWQTQAAKCLNYHLFTKFRIGLSGLPLSAWQHDNWTSAACRHALYVTTSGISSGRQIPRWQGSFLPPKWPAVHGSFLVKNQSFHLIDQKDDKVQCETLADECRADYPLVALTLLYYEHWNLLTSCCCRVYFLQSQVIDSRVSLYKSLPAPLCWKQKMSTAVSTDIVL